MDGANIPNFFIFEFYYSFRLSLVHWKVRYMNNYMDLSFVLESECNQTVLHRFIDIIYIINLYVLLTDQA